MNKNLITESLFKQRISRIVVKMLVGILSLVFVQNALAQSQNGVLQKHSRVPADKRTFLEEQPVNSGSLPLPKRSESKNSDTHVPTSGRSPKSIWVTVTSLVLVLILIIVGASLWKKHGPQVKGGLPADVFQLLGKKTIDQRNTIFFFRVGSKILVVSSGPDGMRTLSEVDDPIEVDLLTGMCKPISKADGKDSPFTASFHKTVGGKMSPRASYPLSDVEGSGPQAEPFSHLSGNS